MLRTDELARLYNQGAQRNFRNDGQLMPIIAFHGGPVELIVQLQPGPLHPSDQLCAIAFGYAGVLPSTHIVTVTESWQKRFNPEDQMEGNGIERGYLENLAQSGDTTVHTALLVTVTEVKTGDCQVWSNDVDEGDEPRLLNAPSPEGLGVVGSGSLPERILDAYREGVEVGAPVDGTWQDITDLFVALGLISSTMDFANSRWN